MNIVDAFLAVLLFLFALRGFFRGLFREVFSLAGLFLGFMVAVRYKEAALVFWQSHWHTSPTLLRAVSFVSLFFVVYFISNVVGWLLHRSAKLLFLQTLNRIGGSALGLGKGAALLAVAVFFLSSSAWVPQSLHKHMEESRLVSPLRRIGLKLIEVTKADILQPGERRGASHRVGTSIGVDA